MKIKKNSDEITYKAETHAMVVEVNGKKVNIVDWYKHDNVFSDYDADTEIDENDREQLTEEEDEELSDLLSELRDWDEGEEHDTDKDNEK